MLCSSSCLGSRSLEPILSVTRPRVRVHPFPTLLKPNSLVTCFQCGFNGNTDEELCNRWMQLGAFMPFMRNHNTRSALSQEPFRWDSVANASRTAIGIRYALLPHWYTLLANTTESGVPPMQALFFQFPDDQRLFNNSDQFLVGSGLLVTPVLTPNVTTVTGVLPGGSETVWRDFYSHEKIEGKGAMSEYTFDAPLGHLPLTIRGGSIHLLHSKPGYTIYETQQSPYELLVALDKDGIAHGSGYFDDGVSMPVTSSKKAFFGAQKGKVYGYASEGRLSFFFPSLYFPLRSPV
jgi:alpha-glucosidase